MDKNLKMGPRAYKKFENATQSGQNVRKMGPKTVGPLSPSLRGNPLPGERMLLISP